VIFLVQKNKIHAHKNILAARSQKFEKMFTGNFKESNQQMVEIPKMKADVFNCTFFDVPFLIVFSAAGVHLHG
jgi:hypothetical protein